MCDCNKPSCKWQSGGGDGGTGTPGGFNKLDDCLNYFRGTLCKDGGSKTTDWGKCSAAVDAAECADHPILTKALRYPTDCPPPP